MKCNRLNDIVATVEVMIVSIGLPLLTFFIGKEKFTAALFVLELTALLILIIIGVKKFKLKQKPSAEAVPRLLMEGIAFTFWLAVAFWGNYMLFAVINLFVMMVLLLLLLMYLFFKYIE